MEKRKVENTEKRQKDRESEKEGKKEEKPAKKKNRPSEFRSHSAADVNKLLGLNAFTLKLMTHNIWLWLNACRCRRLSVGLSHSPIGWKQSATIGHWKSTWFDTVIDEQHLESRRASSYGLAVLTFDRIKRRAENQRATSKWCRCDGCDTDDEIKFDDEFIKKADSFIEICWLPFPFDSFK